MKGPAQAGPFSKYSHAPDEPATSAGRVSARLELDPGVIAETAEALVCFFPQVGRRALTHAWGGRPIDVSPGHLPIFGSRGRVQHGFGFTGNGVGPSYLGGEDPRAAGTRPQKRGDVARDRRASTQALPAGAVPPRRFRMAPPLTITRDEIDLAVEILDASLTAVLAERPELTRV